MNKNISKGIKGLAAICLIVEIGTFLFLGFYLYDAIKDNKWLGIIIVLFGIITSVLQFLLSCGISNIIENTTKINSELKQIVIQQGVLIESVLSDKNKGKSQISYDKLSIPDD